jgi:hypothetical protein
MTFGHDHLVGVTNQNGSTVTQSKPDGLKRFLLEDSP